MVTKFTKATKKRMAAIKAFYAWAESKFGARIVMKSHLLENDTCGLVLWDENDGKNKDYPCLAVVGLDTDEWIGMNKKYQVRLFTPELEVQRSRPLAPVELSRFLRE